MNWRRLLGFDPAVKDGGVVLHRLRDGGEIRVDVDRLNDSLKMISPTEGFNAIVRELKKQKGKPLPDKEKNRLHGLHLDDYQPRGSEHPTLRVVREKSFPEAPPLTFQDIAPMGRLGQERARDWVHYRNRHPGVRDFALGTYPPMRNALHDLLAFLADFNDDLTERGLVAVEVSVQHEPAEQVGQEPQGWHFRVEALAVPQAALVAEAEWHEQYRDAAAKAAAEAKERFAANRA